MKPKVIIVLSTDGFIDLAFSNDEVEVVIVSTRRDPVDAYTLGVLAEDYLRPDWLKLAKEAKPL
jgi:hypothetical protein